MNQPFDDIDNDPTPQGKLTLQIQTLPSDTNASGDMYGGWLMDQMDSAGSIIASKLTQGRVTTVATGSMAFLRPVPVGSVIACYTEILEEGNSSVHILVDVWLTALDSDESQKVTDATFVYVAIDDNGRTRQIKS